jgi:hypothetical protein
MLLLVLAVGCPMLLMNMLHVVTAGLLGDSTCSSAAFVGSQHTL